ncbi:MAG TPA: PIG-L family deacetylase [Acidimicrobiales bacterium]|nr:PIG-L family deacetylase [Acidimicrobiales bacterium]
MQLVLAAVIWSLRGDPSSSIAFIARETDGTYGWSMGRVYRVVSPHLDDAVLSCAVFLAANPGSVVTTVFAGGPASVSPLTEWDAATRYFQDGDDVIAERRREDRRSAELLGAETEHLSFWDEQYRHKRYGYEGPEGAALLAAIGNDLKRLASQQRVESWLVPLGLGHVDHRLTALASLDVAVTHDIQCYVYEELPYYQELAKEVADQIRNLGSRGLRLVEDDSLRSDDNRSLKMAAVRCHRSQLQALGRRVRRAVRGPERIWKVEPV